VAAAIALASACAPLAWGAAVLRLGGVPPRVRPSQALRVEIHIDGARPGPATLVLTLVVADRVPMRRTVKLDVGEGGAGSGAVEVEVPVAVRRAVLDIAAAISGGDARPATAHTEIVPLPPADDIAALLKGKSIGLVGATAELEGFLAPPREQAVDLGGLVGLRSFRGDVVVLHTGSDFPVTPEVIRAIVAHLEAGRSVMWFAGSLRNETFPGSRGAVLGVGWPFALVTGEDLPDLNPGDLAGWSRGAASNGMYLESRWPGARLIWASEAALKEIGSPVGDPAAAWLMHDLLWRALSPVSEPGESMVLKARAPSGGGAAQLEKSALAPLRAAGGLDPSKPLLLHADQVTLKALQREVPDWVARIRRFLERGGRALVVHGDDGDLSFLAGVGLTPPSTQPAPRGAEVALRPLPLLWGVTDPAPALLRSREQLVSSLLVGANGAPALAVWMSAGKGHVLVLSFDPARAPGGNEILAHLLRNLALSRVSLAGNLGTWLGFFFPNTRLGFHS